MTMTQENPSTTTIETPAEAASVPGYQQWCPQCYFDAIERLCTGFTIEHRKPDFPATVVPKASDGFALSLRAARDLILIQRADWKSEAAQHPRHAGAVRS